MAKVQRLEARDSYWQVNTAEGACRAKAVMSHAARSQEISACPAKADSAAKEFLTAPVVTVLFTQSERWELWVGQITCYRKR